MRNYCAVNYLLVQVPEKFESKIRSKSGKEFFKDVAFAGVPDTVRYGVAVSVPQGYDLVKPGDIVYFHHNVTYEQFNHNSNRERSQFLLDGEHNIYWIPLNQNMIYAVERGEDFLALDGFCFVKEVDQQTTFGQFKTDHIGEMVYPSRSLKRLGIDKGDKVVMKFYAEYPFKVHGEQLYRIREKSILGKWIS